ncbi:MAG: hydrogenase expression/formation protein HypE, partial [Propionibacteriaceae bacterium]|nr:hydrogenase expression/formation protein HypE [Propionibacteriaceae bacterium]
MRTGDTITLAHGAGGKASAALIETIFIDIFGAPNPGELTDSAILSLPGGRIAYTTDAYVVNPIRFPGGSIGDLAVNGTVNDLAVSGAIPTWLSAAFIIEEGLAIEELRGIVEDMRRAADRAGVKIVTGDTKVVPRGAGDKVFITTSGIGIVPPERSLGASRVLAGDRLLLSGPIASHGMAVMIARGNLSFKAAIESDSAPVNGLVEALYAALPPSQVHWMRDITRGGLATVANELAADTDHGILLDDAAIPVADPVRGACDMLGIDPLYVANEGCFVAVIAADQAEPTLAALRQAGADQACLIGEVLADLPGLVAIRNAF